IELAISAYYVSKEYRLVYRDIIKPIASGIAVLLSAFLVYQIFYPWNFIIRLVLVSFTAIIMFVACIVLFENDWVRMIWKKVKSIKTFPLKPN
ncbi:MAG: hypothetical protein QXL47_02150, partial [Candidatus Anstonellales archaeon]